MNVEEHYLEIRIEEKPDTVTKIPEGLAGALVDAKLLGYPKAYIKVIWSQVVKGVVAEEISDSILELVCCLQERYIYIYGHGRRKQSLTTMI